MWSGGSRGARAPPMIGVLGGTFDPVHYGHLRPAHEVQRHLGLERLSLMPAAIPPNRNAPVATPEQRLRMVELAVPEFPGLAVDDREIRRGGISYTVPTLMAVREEIGDRPLCFVLGADVFAALPRWHRWRDLFSLAHLIVVERPGAGLRTPPPWAAPYLREGREDIAAQPAGGVLFVPVTPQDISATRLRAAVARGQAPSASEVPAAVAAYIARHHIYRSLPA